MSELPINNLVSPVNVSSIPKEDAKETRANEARKESQAIVKEADKFNNEILQKTTDKFTELRRGMQKTAEHGAEAAHQLNSKVNDTKTQKTQDVAKASPTADTKATQGKSEAQQSDKGQSQHQESKNQAEAQVNKMAAYTRSISGHSAHKPAQPHAATPQQPAQPQQGAQEAFVEASQKPLMPVVEEGALPTEPKGVLGDPKEVKNAETLATAKPGTALGKDKTSGTLKQFALGDEGQYANGAATPEQEAFNRGEAVKLGKLLFGAPTHAAAPIKAQDVSAKQDSFSKADSVSKEGKDGESDDKSSKGDGTTSIGRLAGRYRGRMAMLA